MGFLKKIWQTEKKGNQLLCYHPNTTNLNILIYFFEENIVFTIHLL